MSSDPRRPSADPVQRARELLTVAIATLQENPARDADLALVLDHVAAASSALYAAEAEVMSEAEALVSLRQSLDELTRALDLIHARTTFAPGLDTVAASVAQALALLYPRVRSRERQQPSLIPRASVPPAATAAGAQRSAAPHDDARRADDPPPDEQRAEDLRVSGQRVKIVVDVGVLSASNFYAGVTADVSAGGVFVSTDVPLAVGTDVALFFMLSGERQVSADGVVCWTRQDAPDEPGGMGVAFRRLDEQDRRAIADYCAHRPPLFHD